MQYRHVTFAPLGGITVVAVAKDTLAAINEGTCRAGPSPLIAELLNESAQVMEAAPGAVVIDIRDTQFIDHASVSVLFRLAKMVANHNKDGFICCSSEVKDILAICWLDKVCPTTTRLEDATTGLESCSPA